MKKKIIILILGVIPCTLHAQGFFKKLKDKAAEAATNTLVGKSQQITEKKIDQAAKKQAITADVPSLGVPETRMPADSAKMFSAYVKYDFVPGQTVIYEENFENDQPGELPAGWNSNGSGVVVSLNKLSGNWLKIGQNATYLSSNKSATGKDFTLEFDLLTQFKNGSYILPQLGFGVLGSGKQPGNSNALLKEPRGSKAFEIQFSPGFKNHSDVRLNGYKGYGSFFESPRISDNTIEDYGSVMHVSVSVQSQRIRVWLNARELFDVPIAVPAEDVFNQFFFRVGGSNYKNEDMSICLGNLCMATGLTDVRTRLLNEGKYSTTGIRFDLNLSTVKPESYGTIREIGTLMKENPGLKLLIVGHSDADGDKMKNLTLSLNRALAVKAILTEQFGIADERLPVKGLGSAQPAGSNMTSEGKAGNQRVEFDRI